MKRIFYSFFLLSLSLPLFAHEGHNHEASTEQPHLGGVLRDAPPFKAELLMNGEQVSIYVYDKDRKILKLDKEELKGEIQFPRQDKPSAVTFKKVKEKASKEIKGFGTITEHYETKIPKINKTHRYDLHVTLDVGGKTAKVDFGVDNIN